MRRRLAAEQAAHRSALNLAKEVIQEMHALVIQMVHDMARTRRELEELQLTSQRLSTLEALPAQIESRFDENQRAALERDSVQRTQAAIRQLAKIYPKSSSVVFVGRNYFGDNVKYAFLAFRAWAADQGVKCHFLPDNSEQYEMLKAAGLDPIPPDHDLWTNNDALALLGAKIIVLCDAMLAPTWPNSLSKELLAGAKQVQLWHGISIKEIGMANIQVEGLTKEFPATIAAVSGPFDVFVGTSASSEAEWKRFFAIHSYVPAGYPRNDVLLREPSNYDLVNVDVCTYELMCNARKAGQTVVLYAPTFRDRIGISWITKSALEELNRYCETAGHLLVVNLHPYEQYALTELRSTLSGVVFVQAGTDAYPLLAQASLLITDYSSIAFDYLLLDRPIIHYRPDHKDYQAVSRSLIDGHEMMVGGPCVYTLETLCDALESATAATIDPEQDEHKALRAQLRERLFDHPDGHASERVVMAIAQLLRQE
jgi:CDP-glycerol glycerophosphotransferase